MRKIFAISILGLVGMFSLPAIAAEPMQYLPKPELLLNQTPLMFRWLNYLLRKSTIKAVCWDDL
jgi:hypothetical protein